MLRSEMSGERSPMRRSLGGCSHNSSASSIVSFHGSWAQEVHNAEHDNSRRSSLNKSVDFTKNPEQIVPNYNDSTQEDVDTSKSMISQDREISLEFIEGANEEKFERLLKEEKLKTPFKRRYSQTPSNDSRSESPNDSMSDNGGGGVDSRGNNHSGNFKRSANKEKYQNEAQKRSRYNSNGSTASWSKNNSREREDDPALLSRRQKQIEYGKNTLAYERYVEMVPRQKRTRDHPRTPDKFGKYSRRTFDGLIRVWRKQLHYYDPEPAAGTAKSGANDDDTDSD